ncbi:MAG TPA: GTP cyclohydrolase II [Myxococcota bacterium]|nr:GTP cyclohydrolase II [Myxococcota bacterium]
MQGHGECGPGLRSFGSLLETGATQLDTPHGDFAAHWFQNLSSRRPVLVLTRGDVRTGESLLARVHSSCVTSESLASCDCDCAAQLDASLARIAAEDRGALFYLLQEGRGAGLAAKARDRMIVQASDHQITTFEAYDLMGLGRDQRHYEEVAFACQLLGIAAPLRLLTNNPEKRSAIEAEGVAVAETLALRERACAESAHYLASKSRTGHDVDDPGDRTASLPGPLRYFDPHPLPELRGAVRLAAYWLPVRVGVGSGPDWFLLELFDTPDGERILLQRESKSAQPVALRFERCALVDRVRRGGQERWRGAARALIESGAGLAVFEPLRLRREEAEPDAWSVALLARALGARNARLVVDGARASEFERACASALERRGVQLGAPLVADGA